MNSENSSPKRTLADRLAARHESGRKVEGRADFIKAMLAEARPTDYALDDMDYIDQAHFLRDLFDKSHLVVAIWPDAGLPEGYNAMPVKGSGKELAANPPNDGTVMMVAALTVADRTEAEYLAEAYPDLGMDHEETSDEAWVTWEWAMPGMRENRAAMAEMVETYHRSEQQD